MSEREVCKGCHGSGEGWRVLNPRWPKGSKSHCERTGSPCRACQGTGYKVVAKVTVKEVE